MNVIKFSHNYKKLSRGGYCPVDKARLLEVFTRELETLSKSFLDWDTQNGLYKFPERTNYQLYLILIFAKDDRNLFTTIRRYTEKKYAYYLKKIGEIFAVEVNK